MTNARGRCRLAFLSALGGIALLHAMTVSDAFAYCQDGVLEPELGEQCDDDNGTMNDGCSPQCVIETWVCGDGVVEGTEACDDGNNDNGDGCSFNCEEEHFAGVCGDGIVGSGESCDDGNLAAGDGCGATCQLEVCGNSLLDPGEECDLGFFNFLNRCCNTSCDCPRCGDGTLHTQPVCVQCPGYAPEGCDDGNNVGGDGCSPTCTVEACGNGVVDAGEACDDGNNESGDGCDNLCQIEVPIPYCGDGTLDAGEDCDDGNNVRGDGCTVDCRIERCGDRKLQLDLGEQCDDTVGCLEDCTYPDQDEFCVGKAKGNGSQHAIWLPGLGTDFEEVSDGAFNVNDDGTATFVGLFKRASAPQKRLVLTLTLSGLVEPGDAGYPPAGSPKLELPTSSYVPMGRIDPSAWRYYTTLTGTAVGVGVLGGLEYDVALRPGTPAFQVGVGANGKNRKHGGSGWIQLTLNSDGACDEFPATIDGDINVELDDDCLPCREHGHGEGGYGGGHGGHHGRGGCR